MEVEKNRIKSVTRRMSTVQVTVFVATVFVAIAKYKPAK